MAVENTPIEQRGVSRRTFTTGAAWAAPVVAVAVAAPTAAAASEGIDGTVQVTVTTIGDVLRVSIQWIDGVIPTNAVIGVQLSPNSVFGVPGSRSYTATGTPVGLLGHSAANSFGSTSLTLLFLGDLSVSSAPTTWSADFAFTGIDAGDTFTGSWGVFPNTPGTNIGYAGPVGGSFTF